MKLCLACLALCLKLSHATSKMATVIGAPDLSDSYPTAISTQPWSDCVQSCFGSGMCHLAYGNGSICVFYTVGGIGKVRTLPSTSNEMVSFKLDMPNGDCTGSATGDFEVHTGQFDLATQPFNAVNTFQVTVTPDFFEFVYTYDSPCNTPIRFGGSCGAVQNTLTGFCYQWESGDVTTFEHSNDASITSTPNYMAIKHVDESGKCPTDESEIFNRNGVVIYEILDSPDYDTMDISTSGTTTNIEWK